MLRKKLMVSACAAAMFAMLNARPALAQFSGPLDARTEFTFNSPVELPGVTLPPGSYVFRFVDATTGRKVMQVMSKNEENKTYGLFMTINAIRDKASDNAELRFMETPAGAPAAIKTWWYPGEKTGREFIYPKSQALRLARATSTTVLTTKQENVSEEAMKTTELAYVSPAGQESAVNEQAENASAANTASSSSSSAANMNAGNSAANTSSMRTAPVQESTSASNMSNANTARRRLPRTNTLLPLFGLMGLGSLAGGVTLRSRR